MKAILIRNDGFRKYINIDKKVPMLSSVGFSKVNIYPLDKERLRDLEVPVNTYEFHRSFENEFDEEILIYIEMQ